MTVAEAANYLAISEGTVLKWIKDGKLNATKNSKFWDISIHGIISAGGVVPRNIREGRYYTKTQSRRRWDLVMTVTPWLSPVESFPHDNNRYHSDYERLLCQHCCFGRSMQAIADNKGMSIQSIERILDRASARLLERSLADVAAHLNPAATPR
jgi:hypothetical protein